MRYIFLFLMFFSNVAFADIYILYDKEDNSIYSLSSNNDAVCPETKEKAVISGELKELGLSYDQKYYDFKNGKIKLNMKKVEDDAKKEAEEQKIAEKEELIKERMRKIAIDQLKEEGLIEEE